MGFMYLGLFLWVPFFVVPVIIAIRAMWLALTRPPNYRGEPACERCRYRVAGLSVFTCPECGTDLRRTGIITPAMEMRRRGSTVGAIAGWTLLMVFGGVMFGSVVASLLVGRMAPTIAASMSTTVTTPLTSSTTLYKSLSITNEMSGATITKPDIKLLLTDNAGGTWTMTLDPNVGTSTITGPSEAVVYTGALADEADVKALFDAAKVDTRNPTIQAEIKELSKILAATALSPYANVASMTFKSLTPGTPSYASPNASTTPAFSPVQDNGEAVIISAVGFLLFVLWIGGIAFIVVRRKRLTRELVLMESPRKQPGSDSSGPPPMFPAST